MNANILTNRRQIAVHEGRYLERKDADESASEQWLRETLGKISTSGFSKRRQRRVVNEALDHEQGLMQLSLEQLLHEFRICAQNLKQQGFTDSLVARALAIVRQTGTLTLQLRLHDVQVCGAWAMLQGCLTEMATGEGKTLVAAACACVAASAGVAVHVVTVNDYLAARDAQENTVLFQTLGLTVGAIQAHMDIDERRKTYLNHVVYVSNKELVFDYLKDRISTQGLLPSQAKLKAWVSQTGNDRSKLSARTDPLLRGLHLAIVDEADSVLIDEARTPLIISETVAGDLDRAVYREALDLAGRMQIKQHFEMSAERQVLLQPLALQDAALWSQKFHQVWRSSAWRQELVHKALTALHSFDRDKHYILIEGKVQIVDEFTGRVMLDRTWERGLHQMIEAKEGVEITGQRRTLAQITYQRFFKRYLMLCGMTGTAKEVASEVKSTYELPLCKIPTHRPVRRAHHALLCFQTATQRWDAVVASAVAYQAQGRAVLVGTRSVEASEKLSALFAACDVPHTVLNARQDKDEVASIAQAGMAGRITVATNMAGRGTDIKISAEVKRLGGLHVILTEFHESARIDRQLFGRAARQGDPGSVQAIVSLQDDLFVRYGGIVRWLVRCIFSLVRTMPTWATKILLSHAQNKVQRRHKLMRIGAVSQDKRMQDTLGFAGKQT